MSEKSKEIYFYLYEVLGINKNANRPHIKSAYRNKSKLHHPDSTIDPNHDLFLDIQEAFRVLYNPELRKAYDEIGLLNAENQLSAEQVKSSAYELMFQMFSTMFSAVSGSNDPSVNIINYDFIKAMRLHVKAMQEELFRKEVINDKSISEMNILTKRIKKNNAGENIFVTVLNNRIEEIKKQKQELIKDKRVLECMAAELETYDSSEQMFASWWSSFEHNPNSSSTDMKLFNINTSAFR